MLQQVREMFGARKLTADEAFRKLVVDTAEGKPIPDNAVDICIAAGKSVADYENRVAMLSARRQAAADIKKAAGMTKDIERVGEAVTKVVGEREALEKKHRAEIDAVNVRVGQAFDDQRSLNHVRDELQRRANIVLLGSVDPAIPEQIAALSSRKLQLQNESNRSVQMGVPANEIAAKDRREWLNGLQREQIAIDEQIRELEARRLDPEACVI